MQTKQSKKRPFGLCEAFSPPEISPEEYEEIRKLKEEKFFSPNNIYLGRWGNHCQSLEDE